MTCPRLQVSIRHGGRKVTVSIDRQFWEILGKCVDDPKAFVVHHLRHLLTHELTGNIPRKYLFSRYSWGILTS